MIRVGQVWVHGVSQVGVLRDRERAGEWERGGTGPHAIVALSVHGTGQSHSHSVIVT